jgi:hypothetical protein
VYRQSLEGTDMLFNNKLYIFLQEYGFQFAYACQGGWNENAFSTFRENANAKFHTTS